MSHRAFITGISGTTVTAEEKEFIQTYKPFGFILFARNIENPEQVKALTKNLREINENNSPILIDQEGGRVARLKPPHWPSFPSMESLLEKAGSNRDARVKAVKENAHALAETLIALGIDVDCAPVADLRHKGAHDIIGDRSFGENPEEVALYARALCEGLKERGVLPIIKHIPGHGRAHADSHEELPVVDADLKTLEATDFKPFKLLNDQPIAMTAHIVFKALDSKNCATLSPTVIRYIREEIGFNGILLSDDVSMKALTGSFKERTEALFKAGCDIALHCNGKMEEMREVAAASPVFSSQDSMRWAA